MTDIGLVAAAPRLPRRARFRTPAGASIVVHVAIVLMLVWIARLPRHAASSTQAQPDTARIVWIPTPGPGGGGGGSPLKTPPPPKPEPPKATRTEAPPAPVPTPQITPQPPEPQDVQPPAPAALADAATAGATGAPAVAGGGTGTGNGSGNGAGAGPGRDKGFGGGAYHVGNGVTSPVPIRRASPEYTVEAMRARAQGVIVVECVVEPEGECGDTRVVRSFDPPFGLDREALDAAKRWRFRPGMRNGEPVPVLVSLEIEFNIR